MNQQTIVLQVPRLYGAIVNADINASAAIAGTKISPDFGSQNIVTTGTLTINTNDLIVDSSGRVLIGTTTEGRSTADHLTIASAGHTGMTIRSGTSSGGNISFSDGTSGDDENRGLISYDHAANFLRFFTNAAERFRVDSSGKVHIGLTNGAGQFNVKNSNDASTNALEIYNDNGVRNASFSQNSSGDATIDLRTNSASQTVLLRSNGISHFSGGDFGLGTASPAYTNALFGGTQRTLHVSGTAAPMVRVQSSTSGQADLLLQAGNSGADAYIANAASNGDLVFSTNNGSSQGTRLRILDDGGICFNSDTAAANALDDYEEGTWSPTYKVGSGSSYTMSAATYTSSNTGGTYQKIGRLVTFSLRIQCSSFTINNGAQVTIIGLPFTSTNTGDTGSQHGATFSYAQAICNSNNGYIPQLHIPNNNTEIDFYTCNGNTYQTGDGNNNFGNTLHIHGQYITDA